MNQKLLEKMLDAGFTKDEIIFLVRGEKDPAQEPAQEPAQVTPEPAPEAAQETSQGNSQETSQEQKADPEPNDLEKRLGGIEKNIANLVRAMQLNNVRDDSIKTTPETVEQNADRALTEIIRPPRMERGK